MEHLQAEAKVLSHLDEGGIAAVLLLDNRVVILSPDVLERIFFVSIMFAIISTQRRISPFLSCNKLPQVVVVLATCKFRNPQLTPF